MYILHYITFFRQSRTIPFSNRYVKNKSRIFLIHLPISLSVNKSQKKGFLKKKSGYYFNLYLKNDITFKFKFLLLKKNMILKKTNGTFKTDNSVEFIYHSQSLLYKSNRSVERQAKELKKPGKQK